MGNGNRIKVVAGMFLARVCCSLATQIPESVDPIYLGSRPTLSPDGKRFAFEWCDSLWTAPVQGGVATPLQNAAAKDVWPVYSPDGQKVAFQSDRDGGWKTFELNLAAGKVRQLTFHSEGARPYAWTPDGKMLLANVVRDGNGMGSQERIAFIPVDKRAAETVLFDTYGSEPSLSPDGTRLLFTRGGDDLYRKRFRGSRASQVWLYELTTKTFSCLIRRDTESRTPLWTPDGKGFYYVSGKEGAQNVWHRKLEDGQETQITFFNEDSVIHPCLSQDGRTMVFRHLFDFYRMDPTKPKKTPERIMLVPSSSPSRPESRRRYYNACWNNDEPGDVAFCDNGMQIAFTTGGDLWVMDTVLREPKCVHGDTITHERDCVFSADGQSIYYFSDRGDGTGLMKATRDDPRKYWWENTSFTRKTILSDAVSRRGLSVSPDGARLAWIEPCGNLVVADTNGVTAARWGTYSAVDTYYDWSPDGKWLVASLADDFSNYDVWILPADGQGAPYNVSRHFSWDGQPRWSPDGKIIAFVGQRPTEQTDLFYVWLNRADEERNTLEKHVAAALDVMSKERGNERKDEPAKATGKAAVTIDFEDLHLRVKRISQPDVVPARPFFSYDSRALAFEANIKGVDGTYKVVLPDKLNPELLTRRRGKAVAWIAKDNRLLWMTDNLPAHFERTFPFSVYQETGLSDYQELAFRTVWGKLRDWYYDPDHHGADWDALKEKYRSAARQARSHSVFQRVIALMLGELNSSHLGFNVSDFSKKEWDKAVNFQSWEKVTVHLGLRFDPRHTGTGWKIQTIIPDGPADLVGLKLSPGDVILDIDGVPVSAETEVASVLNGPENRKVRLTVQSGTNAVRSLTIQSSTYSAMRAKQATASFEKARKRVHADGNGKLGYLNIQRMQWDDYYRFEQEIFAEGFGKDGMVIDVRDNTGGFVTDRILGVLCGSIHSIAVARDAAPAYLSGYWGRPVWDKPLVVLCNQNTASNGEIFTHAIKTLKRGKVVGVPTSGAVIATTDVPLLDLGTLRLPHRGWFLPDGTDMELHGTQPDELVWNEPSDILAGVDRQLDAAVRLLKEEVEAAKQQQPPVQLKYAK